MFASETALSWIAASLRCPCAADGLAPPPRWQATTSPPATTAIRTRYDDSRVGTGIEKERRVATVTAVHDYGLDIDIDGRPGFVQPIEIDWTGSKRPTDFVIGDAIEVVVYAETPERCYASIKQTLPDPWSDATRFAVGIVRSGRIGPCVVGAPVAGVVAWLGDGEGIAGNRRGKTRGLAFLGRFLQVGSHEERITHFGLYFRYLDAKTALEVLGIDRPTCWTRATTRADVESALTESGLVWRERRKDWGQALELDSGADIIFDDEDGSLDSIQVSKRR